MRAIGVDVGGTKVAVATLEGGRLSPSAIQPTATSSTEALLEQLSAAISTAAAGDRAALVGVGVPSVVDWTAGRARYSPNIPLVDVPIRDELRARTGLEHVYVDNDASVAALAEACDDAGEPRVDTLVMLTVGTGVGGGVVIGGRTYRGATGAAPELGHMIVGADLRDGAPASDHFPQPGSLERAAAGRELDELGHERGFANGPAVVEAAHAGDDRAREALRILGERLGVGIANVINAFDPQEVVVGGGVCVAGDLLLEPARRTAARFVLTGVGTQTTIRLARWGPQAGVRGAALLAKQEAGRR